MWYLQPICSHDRWLLNMLIETYHLDHEIYNMVDALVAHNCFWSLSAAGLGVGSLVGEIKTACVRVRLPTTASGLTKLPPLQTNQPSRLTSRRNCEISSQAVLQKMSKCWILKRNLSSSNSQRQWYASTASSASISEFFCTDSLQISCLSLSRQGTVSYDRIET